MKKVLAMAVILTSFLSFHVWADQGHQTINNVQVNVDSDNGPHHGFQMSDLPEHEFSLNPGIAISEGAASNYAGNSFSLDADWFRRIHPIVQFGPELGYMFGSKLSGDVPNRILGSEAGDVSGDVQQRVLHITPEFKIGPRYEHCGYQFQPFVIGGGGFYWTHYTSGNLTPAGNSFGGANDVNGGWNVGGGLDFLFPQQFALGVEVRYHHLMYSGGTPDTAYIIPALRLTLFFN